MTFPNVKYTSGAGWNAAKACSAPVFQSPIEGVETNYVLNQDFICNLNDFTPLALNTEHDDFPDFYLVSEGEKRDLGGGKVRWTRIYAQVPEQVIEPGGSVAYHFIGIAGTFGPDIDSATGRERFTRNVDSIIVDDYFIVGANGTGLAVVDYASAIAIPLDEVTRYSYALAPEIEAEYLSDSPPATVPTIPSRTEYLDLCADDAASVSSNSIVISSERERWMGNIWRRRTRKIKAI